VSSEKILSSIIFILSVVSANAFEPLAKPLPPLPESEYSRVFAAIDTGKKVPLALLQQGLFAEQTTVRAYVANLLGTHGNNSCVPYLIDALSDQTFHVGANYLEAGMATTRYWANESLKKLTEKDFGFVWDDSIELRNQAIERWREWYLDTRRDEQP
jgi:hypothetical protein